MPAFDLELFAENGVLRERTVRDAFAKLDWEKYRDTTVHVRGCGQVMVPTWAYLMAAAHLAQVARRITFGEDRSPVPVFVRETVASASDSRPSGRSAASASDSNTTPGRPARQDR